MKVEAQKIMTLVDSMSNIDLAEQQRLINTDDEPLLTSVKVKIYNDTTSLQNIQSPDPIVFQTNIPLAQTKYEPKETDKGLN